LSAFGIVIGIATFVMFLASTEQVAAVLENIFPVEEVEVIPPKVTMVAADTKRLDASTVETIKARKEVARTLPGRSLAFAAFGSGTFNGATLQLEIGGGADGIDASYVVDDPSLKPDQHEWLAGLFKDWDAPGGPRRAQCTPPATGDQSPCEHPDRYYCDRSD